MGTQASLGSFRLKLFALTESTAQTTSVRLKEGLTVMKVGEHPTQERCVWRTSPGLKLRKLETISACKPGEGEINLSCKTKNFS